jgi:hypothetical protein
MKHTLILLILVGISLQNFAQDFAPIGTEWHWDERFAFSGNIDFIKFQSEKDTLINDVLCKKIIKRHKIFCNDRPDVEYLFTRNDTVFFLDTIFNCFQILYDFNAQTNDSWIILLKDETNDIDSLTITVDSTDFQQINDSILKVLYVTYYKNDESRPQIYNSKIIERIGDIQYMFNWFPFSEIVCDANYSNGLRCYQDSVIGLYSTGIANSCDYTYIWTGIEQCNNEDLISIYPNPTTEKVTIEISKKANLELRITDFLGKTHLQNDFSESINIDLSDFKKGIYLISVYENRKFIGSKKILKK